MLTQLLKPLKPFSIPTLLAITVLLIITAVLPAPTTAQTSGGWHATYWNNTDLEGDPVLQIFETDQNLNPELDRNWGNWRPWPQVEKEFFSARWERTVNLQPGRYRFSATADDGIRVWVNGQLIIDEWFNQVVATHRGYYDVTSQSDVSIKVEYYEYQHDAIAKLTWDRIYGSDAALTGQIYEPTITAWRGEYYNNRIVAGIPTLVRDDAEINFNWGLDSPAIEAINAEGFSVRWTRTINLPAGLYRFTTTTDDGVRLFINNRKVIDVWVNQTAFAHTADVNHTGGPIAIKMEYYDALGLAEARLSWEKIGEAGPSAGPTQLGNWRGEYYANTVLAATPSFVQYDSDINFNWGLDSPIPTYDSAELVQDGFSVRWTGNLNLPAGQYQFITSTDDGVRLWVNNQLIIDKWRKQSELAFNATVELPGGPVLVKMEYYNQEHIATAKLFWDRLDGPLPADKGLMPPTAPPPSAGGGSGTGSTSTPIQLPPIDIPPNAPVITVTETTLNVRANASILSDQIGTVNNGDELPVIGRNQFNTWLQVALPDNRLGWVSILYILAPFDIGQLDIVTNPTTAVDVTASGTITPTATVNSTLNEIRSGPNMMFPKTGSLPRNTTVDIIGRSQYNTWLLITLPSGQTGWISTLYVDTNVPVSTLENVEN